MNKIPWLRVFLKLFLWSIGLLLISLGIRGMVPVLSALLDLSLIVIGGVVACIAMEL